MISAALGTQRPQRLIKTLLQRYVCSRNKTSLLPRLHSEAVLCNFYVIQKKKAECTWSFGMRLENNSIVMHVGYVGTSHYTIDISLVNKSWGEVLGMKL